jgi:putative tryptophan/tyrosine transport system substrate-binding protein
MQLDQLKRRDFITLLGGVATAWPLTAYAQQRAMKHRIAVVTPLGNVSEGPARAPGWSAFFKELRRLGYVEGENLVVERYSGGGQEERFNELAREVVRVEPDVIVSAGAALVLAFKTATPTIPVVGVTADPIAFGVATSVARPEGNITGVSMDAGIELFAKHFEIVREIVPMATKVGFLASRRLWDGAPGRTLNEIAGPAGILFLGPPLASPFNEGEYRRVLLAMAQEHADAVIVSAQPENGYNRQAIVGLAAETRLPMVCPFREYVEDGGIISYGPDVPDTFRRIAGYVDRILRGAKPSDLPIYQATKLELVLNMKTAKALGIDVPPTLLARADEVIE